MAQQTSTTGRAAPAFSLPNQDGKKISLKDLRGEWVVLYFYPRDDTPGCTTEACEFNSNWKQFEKLSARVLGVSPDSPETHKKFIAKFDLKFDLLSDPEHKTIEKYGAWGEKSMYGKKYQGVLRTTCLIDPRGKIVEQWLKVKPTGHAQEVAKKLSELQLTELQGE